MGKLLILCGNNRYAKWCASTLAYRYPEHMGAFIVDGAPNLDSNFGCVDAPRVAACEAAGVAAYQGDEQQLVDLVKDHEITTVVCLWWEYILKLLPKLDINIINTHPSYLPFNRGKYPYYWSIVEGTPFGVTIHKVDEGVDTGGILWQRLISVSPTDTGETLYRSGCYEMTYLFLDHAHEIVHERFPVPIRQDEWSATAHTKKEFVSQPWDVTTKLNCSVVELLDELRARTFNNDWSGQEIILDGRRYHIHLNLVEHQDEGSQSS